MDIIKKDTEFFVQHNIIDYSLLIGINYKFRQNNKSNASKITYFFDKKNSYKLNFIYLFFFFFKMFHNIYI